MVNRPSAWHLPSSPQTTYERMESQEFPGLLELQHRHFFDAASSEPPTVEDVKRVCPKKTGHKIHQNSIPWIPMVEF